MGHARVQLYQARKAIGTWVAGGATGFLYLPTVKSIQWIKSDFYVLDGAAAIDMAVSGEVVLQRFTGASWNGSVWAGGAWSNLYTLDNFAGFETASNSYTFRGDWIAGCEDMFKTFMDNIPDVTKPGGSLITANTHTAAPVAGETDLRISVGFQLVTGVVSGTEFGMNVKVMMES
jgi:hypothetical protein